MPGINGTPMGIFLFISGQEIIIIMIVILLLFGADKLPEIARTMGKGMREVRKATDEIKKEFDESTQDIRKDINDVTSSVRRDIIILRGTRM